MLEVVLQCSIAAGGPALTALVIEGQRLLRLRRWRHDNFPVPYLPTGLLSAQAHPGSGHSVARVG